MLLIFNDIAGSEILLILVFILIFFGSKSIPGLAKTVGRTMRQVKEASADIQSEIKKSTGDMKGDLNLKELINDTAEEVRRPLDQYTEEIDNAVKYTPPNKHSAIKPAEVEDVESTEVSEEPKTDQTQPASEITKEEQKNSDQDKLPTDNEK